MSLTNHKPPRNPIIFVCTKNRLVSICSKTSRNNHLFMDRLRRSPCQYKCYFEPCSNINDLYKSNVVRINLVAITQKEALQGSVHAKLLFNIIIIFVIVFVSFCCCCCCCCYYYYYYCYYYYYYYYYYYHYCYLYYCFTSIIYRHIIKLYLFFFF